MNALPRTGLRRITLASATVLSVSLPAFAQDTLTLYTTREPGLINPCSIAGQNQRYKSEHGVYQGWHA